MPYRKSALYLSVLSAIISTSAMADHIDLPTLSVEGVSSEPVPYPLPKLPIATTDSGDLVKQLPGANINSNGPLTSLVQYRGLSGDRVNVLIDGIRLNQAGPNRMDSPLSYMPASRTADVSVYRGIAPVSSGIETIGGTVIVNSKQSKFGHNDQFEFHGNANAGYATNGNTRYSSILASEANKHHRFQISGSVDRGNNLQFADGDIRPTEAKRDTVGLGYGFRQDNNTFSLNVDHHDTGETGTPALPMDIISARSNNVRTQASTLINGNKLTAQLHYQNAVHRMDNYSLRTPGMMGSRYTDANVLARGYRFTYQVSDWLFGLDGDQANHNANIYDPNNAAFWTKNFNDVERDRYSGFVQWSGDLNPDWSLESGARLTEVKMNSGTIGSSMAMMSAAAASLRDSYNSANRNKQDTLVDLTLKLTRHMSQSLDLNFGLARKERAPSYQERYLWIPLQSTSGLADGNNYVGDINLKPETAYQAELGIDWHTARAGFSPRVFYHRIDNYIQGVTTQNATVIMVSKMMMDPTPLQFSNVNAELYGADANWYAAITNNWQLDGTISYVRGKRRDTHDNLYRIAPLTARTKLSYVQPKWQAGIEAVTVAAQNLVSVQNNEKKTGGYVLFNLTGSYKATHNLTVTTGINNLFNRNYDNHLAGYNRVSNNSDIAKGDRLPGLGRSIYASVNLDW